MLRLRGILGKGYRTFVWHRWRRDNDVRIVFVFKTLPEDIHVKGAEKAEAAALTQGSG